MPLPPPPPPPPFPTHHISPGTHTPVGPSFKFNHLQLQTSKLPLREQLSERDSLSCDLWSMGVARWANLKRWPHLAGVRTTHARTHACSYMQKHPRDGSVDFIGRLQYHWKTNTANAIVYLFAYFVQSVCQMQIESIRQLRRAPPAVSDSPYTPGRRNRRNKTQPWCHFGGSMSLKVRVRGRVTAAGEVHASPL